MFSLPLCSPRFAAVAVVAWSTLVGVDAQDRDENGGPAGGARQALSIAVVDMIRVFEAHPQATRAQQALNKERSAMREVFKEKSGKLKLALQEHQELIRAGKKDAAIEKLREVNTLEKEIATLRSTQQRALEEKFADEKSQVLASIRESVAAFNEDGRFDLILDASAAAANGLPTVLDARGAEDITAAVIARVKADDADRQSQAKAKGDAK